MKLKIRDAVVGILAFTSTFIAHASSNDPFDSNACQGDGDPITEASVQQLFNQPIPLAGSIRRNLGAYHWEFRKQNCNSDLASPQPCSGWSASSESISGDATNATGTLTIPLIAQNDGELYMEAQTDSADYGTRAPGGNINLTVGLGQGFSQDDITHPWLTAANFFSNILDSGGFPIGEQFPGSTANSFYLNQPYIFGWVDIHNTTLGTVMTNKTTISDLPTTYWGVSCTMTTTCFECVSSWKTVATSAGDFSNVQMATLVRFDSLAKTKSYAK